MPRKYYIEESDSDSDDDVLQTEQQEEEETVTPTLQDEQQRIRDEQLLAIQIKEQKQKTLLKNVREFKKQSRYPNCLQEQREHLDLKKVQMKLSNGP